MKKSLHYFLILCFLLFLTSLLYSNSIYKAPGINVHYIDVGQGDSILIQVNGKNLLIDSGSKDERRKLFSYLNSLNISSLDYIIATHPHEDHIGNMSEVITTYKFGEFYAPKVSSTSKSFERMAYSIKNNSKKINVISPNTNTIDLGEHTKVKIFSPTLSSYNDLNNYSPIIRISYKNISFLFTGDAEASGEALVLSNDNFLKSNVLKLGHHGSSSSTSLDFLKAVDPSIAIISCGKDNPYGHPHKETLERLYNNNIRYYSTSIYGTITLSSDGTSLWLNSTSN